MNCGYQTTADLLSFVLMDFSLSSEHACDAPVRHLNVSQV